MKLINEKYKVSELSTEELQNTNGGGDTWIWFGKLMRNVATALGNNSVLLQG